MRIKHYPGARVKQNGITNSGLRSEEGQKTQPVNNFLHLEPHGSDKWSLGGCPRCHGDVFLDTDEGEVLGHCLQCGYVGQAEI